MLKVFSGNEFKTPRGSLSSLSVSPPVLITVVVTLKFSNPLTSIFGVEVLTVKQGATETTTVEAMRTMRGVRREGESIVKAGGEMTPMDLKPWDWPNLA